jgi:hypothetical protein
MTDPAARRAYVQDLSRHDHLVNIGNAEGPQEPKQYREDITGGGGDKGKGHPRGRPLDQSATESGLGRILEQALAEVTAAHPEYTRAQAVLAAMKIPHVAAAYDRENNIRNAIARGVHL